MEALKNVSFKIEENEIVALLGPNGAGKTTTIRCISSLAKTNKASKIEIAGVSVLDNPRKAREFFGVCAQEYNLYTDSTGKENLELQAYFYGIPKKISKDRISELLDLVKLVGRQDDLVRNYSGGMKRRLQIARALVCRPKLLLLDEPTLGLSPQARKGIWQYLLKLRGRGMSILFTTHYMEEAEMYADRVLIMDQGEIVADGSPEDLKQQNLHGSFVQILSPEVTEIKKHLEDNNFKLQIESTDHIRVKSLNNQFSKLFKELEGFEITELILKQPSLEDVFLEITGSSLIENKDEFHKGEEK